MKNGNRGAWILAGLAAMVFSGCVAAADPPAPLTNALSAVVLDSGRHCLPASATWKATWITNHNRLLQFVSRCRENQIGTGTAALAPVDFNRFGVLAIEMGQRRTAGYGIDGASARHSPANRTLFITLTCRRPSPGRWVAQIMSSPWILIQLPLGSYGKIAVNDQDTQLLTQFTLE
ncbi:protease complex subunit PrcB family protein [Desulfosarcina ovata]|uniref:protease complex subunit PrcB family protein n=1 Tax=Desulfosarcina ovata TaxID=83564 RepID=UPI0012D3697F|nr:protease complex subunit PrcB family protein [Desulfosarcina ovata]